MKISIIHNELFNYLYRRFIDEGLLFMPRIKNYKERLQNGYYFIGDDNYMQVSFWNGRDWKEKIHSISFVVTKDKESYIEISGRDDDEKAKYLRALVQELQLFSDLEFVELYNNKWKADYSTDNYLDNLESFIDNEKEYVDDFLKKSSINGISFIDLDSFNRATNRIFDIKPELKDIVTKKKYEGNAFVKKTDYTMTHYHNILQNMIYNYMIGSDEFVDVELEKQYVDIVAKDTEGQLLYFELKPTSTKKAIRQAMGQLFEYSFYPGKKMADKLIVVSYSKPTKDDIDYLEELRSKFKVPMYYRFFDINKKRLSELY